MEAFKMKTQSRILIVDDEQAIRDTLYYNLTERGFLVETAANGNDALAKMKNHKFNAVLSDIVMADCDGIKFLEALRAEANSIPVLLFTGYASVESSIKAVNLKAFAYLKKPVSIDELVDTLDRAINSYKSAQKKEKIFKSYIRRILRFKEEKKIRNQKDGLVENDINIPVKTDNYSSLTASVMAQTRQPEAQILIITKNNIISENISKLLKHSGFMNYKITGRFSPIQCANYSIVIIDTQNQHKNIVTKYNELLKLNSEIKFIPIVDCEKIKNKLIEAGCATLLEQPVHFDTLLKFISWESYIVKCEKIKRYMDGMPLSEKIFNTLKFIFFKKIDWKYSAVILLTALIAGYVISNPQTSFFIENLKKGAVNSFNDSQDALGAMIGSELNAAINKQIEYIDETTERKTLTPTIQLNSKKKSRDQQSLESLNKINELYPEIVGKLNAKNLITVRQPVNQQLQHKQQPGDSDKEFFDRFKHLQIELNSLNFELQKLTNASNLKTGDKSKNLGQSNTPTIEKKYISDNSADKFAKFLAIEEKSGYSRHNHLKIAGYLQKLNNKKISITESSKTKFPIEELILTGEKPNQLKSQRINLSAVMKLADAD